MAPRRRLARITAHLQGAALRRPRTASVAAEPDPKPLLLDDREMKEFIKSGVHMIPPGSPGMPDASVHYANWEDACAMQESATAGVHSIADNVIASVPGVRDVLESPAVRGVLQSVLGKGYTYHPHHFMHMTSPQTDQFWHKDSGRPWGGRKMRHHHSIEAMLLYYPMDCEEDLGPTVLLPMTSYWEDGPKPPEGGIPKDATPEQKDDIFSSSFDTLGWPRESAPHKVIVKAGTLALVHFDIYHRGSRRLESADDEGRKRVMYKFWLSRTEDPVEPSWDHTPAPDDESPSAFADAPGGLGPVWTHSWNYLRGCPAGGRGVGPTAVHASVAELQAQITGTSEPERIAAAYELAALAPESAAAMQALSDSLLAGEATGDVLGNGGDKNDLMELGLATRRAAVYGLVALGPLATPTFAAAARHESSEVRAYGAHGLGESGALDDDGVVSLLAEVVATDDNRFVRACAAEAVGCAARRAAALRRLGQPTPTEGAWAAALLPGLALGGEEVGSEGGAGDASRQKSGVLKFTTRNMVRECASISALSICANAAALPSVPEADWLALIATLAGLVSARDGDPRDDDRFSYGFEVQALHRLASGAGALPTAVAEAAAAAVAEPLVWVPPELLLANGTPSLEIEQPHFDTERFLWVPAPEAAA